MLLHLPQTSGIFDEFEATLAPRLVAAHVDSIPSAHTRGHLYETRRDGTRSGGKRAQTDHRERPPSSLVQAVILYGSIERFGRKSRERAVVPKVFGFRSVESVSTSFLQVVWTISRRGELDHPDRGKGFTVRVYTYTRTPRSPKMHSQFQITQTH